MRCLEGHQLNAFWLVQAQLGRALQRQACHYGNEADTIQLGERVWLLIQSLPPAGNWLSH